MPETKYFCILVLILVVRCKMKGPIPINLSLEHKSKTNFAFICSIIIHINDGGLGYIQLKLIVVWFKCKRDLFLGPKSQTNSDYVWLLYARPSIY